MIDVSALTAAWQQVHALAHDAVAPIEDEAQYDRALVVLGALLAEVGEDGDHPLADLVEGLIGRVTAYQAAAGHVPPAAPDMELRLLVKERGLTQQELAAATGIDQGQISRLMTGRRTFTAEHVRRLSSFFGVQAGTFLGMGDTARP